MAAHGADIIPLAERHTLKSKVLDEQRSYLVWRPEGYDPNTAYPVLYLLDGVDHLMYIGGIVDYLQFFGRIPPMLIVAIENTNRNLNFTPPSPEPNTGGAERFLRFIENELITDVEKQYKTRPYRLLVGHSHGGLFTIYTLLYKPRTFNAYIAFSPTLWWNEGSLLKKAETITPELKELPIDLFFSVGNEESDMVGSALKLATLLEESVPWEDHLKEYPLRWNYRQYVDETHMSTGLPTIIEGLRAIFNDWQINDPVQVYEYGGFAALQKHYQKVSDRMGYEVPIPYSTLTELAQIYSKRQRLDDAELVMQKAVELYPDNVYARYGLARVYVRKDEKEKAVQLLEEVLKSIPSFEAAKKLLSDLNQ